jgi:hypothetical protein
VASIIPVRASSGCSAGREDSESLRTSSSGDDDWLGGPRGQLELMTNEFAFRRTAVSETVLVSG